MIKETFKQAVQNVLSNKVRTFLTMLGIIIGVMAVIVIVGLGNGMTNMMQDFYSDMGSDILSVNIMTASTRSVEVDDVYRIINEKPEYYKGLSPIASVGGDTLRVAGEKYRRTYISGVNEDYTTINNYKVAKGRGIQYTDLIDNKNICVIGDYVDRKIFGGNGLGSTQGRRQRVPHRGRAGGPLQTRLSVRGRQRRHCSRSLYHPDERQQHQQCQPVLCGPAGRGPLG